MAEPAAIVSRERTPTLGLIELSATITETHTREAEVSEHALERGATIVDHRRKKPIDLQMDAIIGEPDSKEEKERIDPTGDLIQRQYDALLTMFEKGETFQVITGLAIYESMTFKRLSVSRDGRSGNAIRFTAYICEVRFADSEVVEVISAEADKPKTTQTKDLGKKTTKRADPKVEDGANESMARKLFRGIAGGNVGGAP